MIFTEPVSLLGALHLDPINYVYADRVWVLLRNLTLPQSLVCLGLSVCLSAVIYCILVGFCGQVVLQVFLVS